MKLAPLFLVVALATNSIALPARQATEAPNQTSDSKNAAKVKAEVQKRGIGKQSRLKVTLRDQTEVKGYASQIGDASFQITNPKTQDVTTLAYADVKKETRLVQERGYRDRNRRSAADSACRLVAKGLDGINAIERGISCRVQHLFQA